MEDDICVWVTEFLLRSSDVDDLFLKKVLSVIDVPDSDFRLKKAVLLKAVENEMVENIVTERILEFFEIIEQLDKDEGHAITDSLKAAYCAVALECTMKNFRAKGIDKGGKYSASVKRIWSVRVAELERVGRSELLSPDLKALKKVVEATLCDYNASKKLLKRNTRHEALERTDKYIRDARAALGPSFVDLAAGFMAERKTHERVLESATETTTEGRESAAMEVEENLKTTVLPKCNPLASQVGGATISHLVDLENDGSAEKYTCLDTPEFNRAREALKASTLELQAVVEDPLPNALRIAESVGHDIAQKNKTCEHSLEDRNVAGPSNPINTISAVPLTSVNAASASEKKKSMDDSSERSQASRLHLPSPKRRKCSPLKKYVDAKFVRRRQRKNWSLLEEDTLRTAVQTYGKGNWKLILNAHRDVFEERTEVDLKDKWRNMTRY